MEENNIEAKRSRVRRSVTYFASAFLFGGGALLIAALFYQSQYDMAKDIFLSILPVSAAVVSYWFASRGKIESDKNSNKT